MNRGAGLFLQFQVAGNEVGMEVREDDVPDRHPVLGGKREVLIDVTLRVDNRRRLRLLVANEIRRVRKAIQVELVEDHR
jgi:hypothetical protein